MGSSAPAASAASAASAAFVPPPLKAEVASPTAAASMASPQPAASPSAPTHPHASSQPKVEPPWPAPVPVVSSPLGLGPGSLGGGAMNKSFEVCMRALASLCTPVCNPVHPSMCTPAACNHAITTQLPLIIPLSGCNASRPIYAMQDDGLEEYVEEDDEEDDEG